MNTAKSPVQEALDSYAAAVFEKNLEGFLALYDEGARIFDAWNSWQYEGRSHWREVIKGWFDALGEDSVEVRFSDIQAHASTDAAFGSAFATYTAVNRKGERLRSQRNRITVGMRKVNDAWVIAHQHTSLPLSFETKLPVD